MPDTTTDPTTDKATELETVYLTVVQIYQFHDEASGQTLWWNATEGRRLAEGRNAEVVLVYPAEFGMDKARILHMNADLDQQKALALPATALLSPLLFVEHNGKHILIDGWHRLFLAVSCGVPCLPAYILTQKEADHIRVNGAKGVRLNK